VRALDTRVAGLHLEPRPELAHVPASARLVPCATGQPKDKVAAIEKFISFIRKNPVRKTGDIKALIEEGRM
jgi:hypothetical protein